MGFTLQRVGLRAPFAVWLVISVLLAGTADAALIYSLGAPAIGTGTVRIPFTLTASGLSTARVVYLGADVGGSAALTTPPMSAGVRL